MAPKKSTGKHSCKPVETSSQERRTKYKKDVLTQMKQVIEEQALSSSSMRQVMSMAMHPVTSGRCIIFSFLKDLGLQVEDRIKKQGWSFFCSMNVPTYLNLVRSFYKNLILGEGHIESRVKGKRIMVTKEILGNLL